MKPLKPADYAKIQEYVEVLYNSAIEPPDFMFVNGLRQRMQQAQTPPGAFFTMTEVRRIAELYKLIKQEGPITREQFLLMYRALIANKVVLVEEADLAFLETLEMIMLQAVEGVEKAGEEIKLADAERVRMLYKKYRQFFEIELG